MLEHKQWLWLIILWWWHCGHLEFWNKENLSLNVNNEFSNTYKESTTTFCKAHCQQLKIYTTLYLYTVTGPRNPRTVCLIYPRIVLCKNPQGGLTCRNPPIRINKLSRLRTFTLVTHKKNMQPETYYDTEERPPGDDDYTWAGGKTGPAATCAGTRSGPREHHASILLPRGHRRLHTST